MIELLIVVAIILVIAAIAIPSLLQAKISANEASAVGSLRAMTSAEAAYYGAYPTVGYATTIAALGGTSPCSATSATACLIDNSLATSTPGSGGKSGYVFQATGLTTGGAPYNDAYVLGTAPVAVGTTGNQDYCSANDGVLRSQMASAGDTPVTVLSTCLAFPVAQ